MDCCSPLNQLTAPFVLLSGTIDPLTHSDSLTQHPETGWLFNGHFGGSLAALAASPTEPVFCSGGADGTLRLYSSESHAVTKVYQLSTAAAVTCAAYHPTDGSTLAVGVGGGVDVLDPSDLSTRKASCLVS